MLRWLRLPLYPPVWFLIQFGLIWAAQRWLANPLPLPGHRVVGGLLALGGIALSAAAIFTVRRARTPLLPYQQPEHLLSHGPFRWSRNPIYLGEAIFLAGLALRSGQWVPWLVLPCFVLGLTFGPIRWEERALRRRFGAAFETYCQRTRRWL